MDAQDLGSLTANSASQLNIFWHYGHAFSVNGTQICVLKQANKVALASLLQCHYSCALEPQISLEVLSNFAYKSLERQLSDQELS